MTRRSSFRPASRLRPGRPHLRVCGREGRRPRDRRDLPSGLGAAGGAPVPLPLSRRTGARRGPYVDGRRSSEAHSGAGARVPGRPSGAPGRPGGDRDDLQEALGGRLPEPGEEPLAAIEQLARAADPGLWHGRAALLRLCHRRRRARRARRRLADLGLGPERHPLRQRALEFGRRGDGGRLAAGDPGSAAHRRSASRPAASANFTGLAAARHAVLPRRGWNVEEQGLPARRRATSSSAPRRTSRSSPRSGCSGSAPRGEEGDGRQPGANGCGRRWRGPEIFDGPLIVCPQAGNVNTAPRSAGRDRHRARARRVGSRRRRLRPLGGGGPDARALRPGRRAGRLLGRGQPQMAERPVRLRHRVRWRPAAHRAAMTIAAEYLDQTGGRSATRSTTSPSSRAAPAASRLAALRDLGRHGVDALIERCCASRGGSRTA